MPRADVRRVVVALLAALVVVVAIATPASARRGDSCRHPFKLIVYVSVTSDYHVKVTDNGGDDHRINPAVLRMTIPRHGLYIVIRPVGRQTVMCKVLLYESDGTIAWRSTRARGDKHRWYFDPSLPNMGFAKLVLTARRR